MLRKSLGGCLVIKVSLKAYFASKIALKAYFIFPPPPNVRLGGGLKNSFFSLHHQSLARALLQRDGCKPLSGTRAKPLMVGSKKRF